MADEIITIEGLAECQQWLKDMPQLIVRKAFPRALGAGAHVIAAEIDRRVRVHTGQDLKGKEVIAIALDPQLRGGEASVGFGRHGDVAEWVEYGHRMVSHAEKQIGQVPAYPFMRPAADAAFEPAVEAFADSLDQSLDEMKSELGE